MAAAGDVIRNQYEVIKEIGNCNPGCAVYMCKDKATGEYVACKCISKTSSAFVANSVRLEIETMKMLQTHPEVVGLKQVYEDDKHVDIVMEYCHGGDLCTRLIKQTFTERKAKILFKKLMKVAKLCHDWGIVHRDIKPENIFLTTEDECLDIKLGDFGFATCIQPGKLHEKYGIKYCIAPEMLYEDPYYDQAVDVWSAGVVLYVLLSGGTLPFNADNDLTIQMVRDGADSDLVTLKLVREWDGNLRFNPPRIWDCISPSARDLLTRILCKDPIKRLTAAQVLNHSWMRNKEDTNCCVIM
ncbi:hypothetical protein MKX01_029196 [Papaver californicum]|nr:hypothetical protein MKX01_029196 [Papaver californicum]